MVFQRRAVTGFETIVVATLPAESTGTPSVDTTR
jgi:hypothetical protein